MNKKSDIVYLDLVSHIKQYLDEFDSSLFHKTDEVDNILNKKERGDELSVDEIILIVDYQFRHKFKENILKKESLILPDDIEDINEFINEYYNEERIYLLYESYYVIKFLNEAPEIINRGMKLKKIFAKENPSKRVKEFCKEAYLTYINGYFISSVVLLRSIIETLLKDKLNYPFRVDLFILNDVSIEFGLYDESIWKEVDKIRKKGNKVIHDKFQHSITDNEIQEVIISSQNILENIFNSKNTLSIEKQRQVRYLIKEKIERKISS